MCKKRKSKKPSSHHNNNNTPATANGVVNGLTPKPPLHANGILGTCGSEVKKRVKSHCCLVRSPIQIPDSDTGPMMPSPAGTSKGVKATMTTYNVSPHHSTKLKGLNDEMVFESVEKFVQHYVEEPSKRRPIKRLLVATNGIAAVRCVLTIRRMLQHHFNNDRAIKFICITTEQEITSQAEYIKLADEIVTSPGGENRNNYANVDEIVSHALEKQVDAVWAGWGHASENPELPRRLAANNIVFIGPPADAMHALGDKIASTIIAQSVGIPTIAWSGSGLTIEQKGNGPISVSTELFHKACVQDVDEGIAAMKAHNIGYPMMIKASEGGGGKGIRKCLNEFDFKEHFLQVQTEVPGSPIFLMKCLENARHIEVQLIADRYGNVIPIFTRDCSIQRRCQKIIEEAPAQAREDVLKSMQQDAVRIAEIVGYESAGTVEYMYLPAEEKYFFLELNPRLQVEHPCTEMLTNINIPAIQMQIAMGLPLNRIKDVRILYGLDYDGTSSLPEDKVLTKSEYCVIAARITSEDPGDFFRPSTGSIELLNFRSAQNVWGYFSVSSNGKVHEFADSQFGHLFARGRTRNEAISTMLCALQELELRTTFTSQVSYLTDLLNEEDFKENRFNTQWLDKRIADRVALRIPIPAHELIALSGAIIGYSRVTSAFNNFRNAIERGQVLPTKDLTETFLFDLIKDMHIYQVQVTRTGPSTFMVFLNGGRTTVDVRQMGENSLLVQHKEKCYQCFLEENSEKFKVTIGRTIVTFEKDNDPTVLKSPYTGRLLGYKCKNKELVTVGQVYAAVESMKLVFNVEVKKVPGRLEQIAKEGDLLFPGSVIARIIEQKNNDELRPKPFKDVFAEWIDEPATTNLPQYETKRFDKSYEECRNLLNGSCPPGTYNLADEFVEDLFEQLENTALPHAMLKKPMEQALSQLNDEITIRELRTAMNIPTFDKFRRISDILDNHFKRRQQSEFERHRAFCNGVYVVCEKFIGGLLSHMVTVVNSLLNEYKHCEKFFECDQYTDAVALLNEEYGSDKDKVVSMIYSHTQLKAKNKFMVSLLNAVEKKGMYLVAPLEENLIEIGNLFKTEEVSKKCRHLMLLNSRIKYRKFVNKILWDVDSVPLDRRDTCDVLTVRDAIDKLRAKFAAKAKNTANPQTIFDCSPWSHKVIHEFFFDPVLADIAIRAYIGQHFAIDDVKSSQLSANNQSATVYDACIDNSNLMHYMSSENSQWLSIVKFSVNFENFHEAVTHNNIITGLVEKFTSMGIKSNGRKSTLRVTFLVNVIDHHEDQRRAEEEEEERKQGEAAAYFREALLEELPQHSKRDEHLVDQAEIAAKKIRKCISDKLAAVEVIAHVLVCNRNKPLMQVDLLGAEKLELWRLPSDARLMSEKLSSLHVYQVDDPTEKRFSRIYVREIVELPIRPETPEFELEVERAIVSQMDRACGAINVTMSQKIEATKNVRELEAVFVGNHLLLSVTFPKMPSCFTKDNEEILDEIFVDAIKRMRPILFKHHVTEVEVVYAKVDSIDGSERPSAMKRRVKYLDKTGVTPEFGIYDECKKNIRPVARSFQLYEPELSMHHPIKKIEKKRSQTRNSKTTYVYDYPMLFGRACLKQWKNLQRQDKEPELFAGQFKRLRPEQQEAFLRADYRRFYDEAELVFIPGRSSLELMEDKGKLKERADNCSNETGMVAWKLKLYTPEKPHGYTFILIANDLTVQQGSFATAEDDVYSLASQYSRKYKLPRVNMSCNSGARIGLAEDVAKLFRVKFRDNNNLEEGFEYLFLEPSDYEAVKDQVVADKLPNGTYKLRAVVGRANEMIGVENLQGSGLIAGETSAAYDEVPTYCFVTGRSVGIGAYTARLAHRIVQARSSHIILTGAQALNTVLGKEVYTSNNQLGGIEIMYNNGVTHAVVENDFEGVAVIIHWMGYLPDITPTFPYVTSFGVDSAPRPVTYNVEQNKQYDIRELIDSRGSDEFSGICDSHSFNEIMNDWAKTIIAGRARLCGMPIGVVSSELRNVCSTVPADPATPHSQSIDIHQAGQVWFPDSAFKTAEVIGDFNREGLPLLFFASLRGFSGGQKDMYEMVLKFGAHIVDALRQYKQPVIIYIPVHGELRGGAWAVLDSKINPGFITMIADSRARGGILEPSAIVKIKLRGDKLLAVQKRNDEIMANLHKDLQDEDRTTSEKAQIQKHIQERSKKLEKAYRGISEQYADLHDRPERMKIRNAVHHVVDLRDTRTQFASIFRLEMAKVQVVKRYLEVADRTSTYQSAMSWINERLQGDRAPQSPTDQYTVLERAVTSGEVDAWLKAVRESSVDKELEEMSDDEIRELRKRIELMAVKRKFSL